MSSPREHIIGLIQEYEETGKEILKSILELGVYSEGSYSKDELMQMSHNERKMIIEILKEKNDPSHTTNTKMDEHFKKNPNKPYIVQDR